MSRKLALLLSGVIFLSACKKLDIDPPVVDYFYIENHPDNIVLKAGDFYSMYYGANDNSGINHIDIKVTKGFFFEQDVERTGTDFFYSNGSTYDQKVKTTGLPLNIPASAMPGSYRISVTPKDNNNNVYPERYLEFILTNGKEPKITSQISSPLFGYGLYSDSIQAKRGDNLQFNGGIVANNNIKKLKVDFYSNSRNPYHKIIDYKDSTTKTVDLKMLSDSLNFTIDPITVYGDYKFVITAIDDKGQAGVKIFKIHVPY